MPKMKRAKIVKLSLDELAGVDAGAQAEAGAVILKRKVDGEPPRGPVATNKRSALTSAVMGHTHLINGVDDMQSGCTSSEYIEPTTGSSDYTRWHSHPWIRNDAGEIVLGESVGHTHEVAQTAASLAKHARGKSTAAKAATTVDPQLEIQMPNADQQIADLSKRSSLLMKALAVALTLPEAHRAHAATLSADESETFLAKAHADREAIVKAAQDADPVVFKGEVTGVEVRKSHGDLTKRIAEQNEANAKANAALQADVAKARESAETEVLKAEAAKHMSHFIGEDSDRIAVYKAAKASGEGAVKLLDSANAALKMLGQARGVNPGDDPVATDKDSAFTALTKGLTDFAKAQNIPQVWTEGLTAFVQTPEGAALKRAYDAAK